MSDRSSVWPTVWRGTVNRFILQGFVANIVVGVVLVLVAPALGYIMRGPKVAIICVGIALTVIIWVAVVYALKSVPSGGDEVGASPQPVSTEAPPPPPSKVITGSETTQSAVGDNNIQAGRDVILNQSPAAVNSIRSLMVELRLTCETRDGAELPPDEVPFIPLGDAHAYLEGTAGKQRLDFVSPVRFRKLSDQRVVVINRFALQPGSDLADQPVSRLEGYDTLSVPVVTIVYGNGFRRFGRLEVSLSLNGNDPVGYGYDYDVEWQPGPRFSIPFSELRQAMVGK